MLEKLPLVYMIMKIKNLSVFMLKTNFKSMLIFLLKADINNLH